MPRLILPVLTIAALLGLTFAVATAGDLAAVRAKQQVAVQKLTGDVDKAIADSRKMEASGAKTLLQTTMRRVTDDPLLPNTDRTTLVSRLKTRINQVSEAERGINVAQDQKPLSEPPARKKFDIPTSGGSSGGYRVANDFINSAKGAQKIRADGFRQRADGRLAMDRDIERVLPMDKEINFPKNWKEITDRRKDYVSQRLTAQEVKLLKTLNSTMSVSYDGDKFKAVINHLQDRTGLGIIIDEGSLRDVNVDYDDPVTFKAEKLSVRTVLKKVLGDKGLTYIIKEGNLQVMTPKKASEYTVMRSYPISDLITPIQGNVMFGPFVQQFQKQQNAQQVINMIVFMTGPDYWQPNGPGSISFFTPTDSLVIRASAEMHYQLASPGLFGR